MGTSYNPGVVTDGLRHVTDSVNIKSYVSGSTITDLVTGGSGSNSIPNANVSWMNAGVSQITFNVVLKRLTTSTAYSSNPFTKYTSTTDNTFSMYVFGTNSGSAPADDGVVRMYTYCGGVWGSIGAPYPMAVSETVLLTWQFNSVTGAQTWVNGVKYSTRTGRTGVLGSAANTSNMVVQTLPGTTVLSLFYTSIYDRELSDAEIVQNYNALKGRYGL